MNAPYHSYGFGLDFQSAIPLPEMRQGRGGHGEPVVIHLGNADCPKNIVQIAPGVAAGPLDFWMDVPGIASMHVTSGAAISINPAQGASISDVRLYLLGSAMGALLHQRGFLPLHASAVEIDGKAVAFCGASGAGKSTLALDLVKSGQALLCDDICALDIASGTPRLWPGLVNLKLWRQSLEAAGEEHHSLEAILPSQDKYRLPIASISEYRSYPVGHVFQLGIAAKPPVSTQTQTAIQTLPGADRVGLLVANTFRGQLVEPMRRNQAHFSQCVAIASTTDIAKITRPWSLPDIEATRAAVLSWVRKL
jgi:hypothetical protein